MKIPQKLFSLLCIVSLLAITGFATTHQEKASVNIDQQNKVKAGETIAFTVKLDAPLPEGAYFQMRISPVSVDQEIPLSSGNALDASRTTFRVSGTLPKAAIPGPWHISVIYLFLPGTSWTFNTIRPNNLTFTVTGPTFAIPKSAEVSLVKQ